MVNESKSYQLFLEIAAHLPEGKISQMFGCPCVKVPSGKAAFCIYKNDLVIKLDKETEKEMLAYDDVDVFMPKGDRPMNGWTQVPYTHKGIWLDLAQKSFDFVNQLQAKAK